MSSLKLARFNTNSILGKLVGASTPLKPWSKCFIENLGGSILASLGGEIEFK